MAKRIKKESAFSVEEAVVPYGVTAPAIDTPGERRVLLHGVRWDTYKSILKDIGDSRACRFAFNSGELEIMSPLQRHESSQFSIGHLIVALVDELGLECIGLESLTCEREDLQKAIEPDGCFYIRNFARINGITEIDFTIHPPPDLMIEVDISTNSMNKLPICAALGVPEHWRFDGEKLEIRLLRNGRYVESTASLSFPHLPLTEKVPEMLKIARHGVLAMGRTFRKWIRDELSKQKLARPRKKIR